MARNSKEYRLAIRIAGEIDKTLPKSIQLSKAELRAIAKEATIASKEMSKSSGAMNKSFMNTSHLNETKGFFTAIEKAGVRAFKAIGTAASTAGIAVGMFSVKTGMEYEKQMSTVKAISKASESDFKALQDEAKRIGATTASTAKEAGQAMEYEAMAGWKADEIVAATSAIVDLKQSSDDLDLSKTSDILTDAVTAFKMKAKDATHMADVLAATSTSANTDVAKMGESFKYAAPMAGSMGYSVEDTALTLGLMANSGIKSSMAGTTERNWIKRMVKPTKESEQAMKKLNLSTKDKDGKSKSLLEITEDTRKAFAQIKDTDKKSKYAAMLAGAQGMSGLLAIVNESEKNFKSLKKSIYDCDGAAKDLAKIKLDNLEGDVTLFTSAMQGAGVDIYEEIKEPLRDLVQSATKWVGSFSKDFTTAFPTVVRYFRQGGEAIQEFSAPFLKVGEWMLDNPDVISGTIAGIGTAIVSYKVISGVSGLVSALGSLSAASLPILGATAVAGVIAGWGVAASVAGKRAKEASLDRHFGDIALSMEAVQRISKEIVGTKKLAEVDELFQSMDAVEDFAKSMARARKEFSKVEWKVSAGLKVSKEDKESYESNVKAYVKEAQELIAEKGYEIDIATNILFGDSKKGQQLTKENQAFFNSLEAETSTLSGKINKQLKKAMKDGFTVDIREELDSLLSQLSEATSVLTEAEAEASWDVMSARWSGKELNADSFKNLSADVKGNLDSLKQGAEDSYQESLKVLNARHIKGDLSDKEYEKEKQEYEKAYHETISESNSRAAEFMYNTMMDSYGQVIASGEYAKGDKDAIREIISYIEEYEPDHELKGKLNSISVALNQNALTKANKIFARANGESDIYSDADKESKQIAQEYLEGTQKNLDEKPLNLDRFLIGPSAAAAKKAQKEIINSFSDMSSRGLTVSLPIRLQGSYSVESSGPVADKTVGKINDKNPLLNLPGVVKPYAKGGIATEPTLLVAEAGVSESIIPLDGSSHSVNLWKKTGQLLGAEKEGPKTKTFSELLAELSARIVPRVSLSVRENNSGGQSAQFVFSPNITIQGSADVGTIRNVVNSEYANFKKMFDRYEKEKGRRSLKRN